MNISWNHTFCIAKNTTKHLFNIESVLKRTVRSKLREDTTAKVVEVPKEANDDNQKVLLR